MKKQKRQVKKRSNIFCIVDTSALRHWKNVTLADRPIDKWLESEFDIRISKDVAEEIDSQRKFWPENIYNRLKKRSKDWIYKMTSREHIESVLFSHFLDDSELNISKDAGERRNFCVTVKSVMEDQCRHVVFLTDDFDAIKKFLQRAFEAYVAGCVWTSYDLLLYLFLRHKASIHLKQVQNSLRDLTSNIQKPGDGGELTKRLTKYNELATIVDNALRRL